jgi:hypothetical protein
MKIRIKDNSIRFRLTKSEVHKLCTDGALHAQTEFANNTFFYAVKVVPQTADLTASYDNNCVTLYFAEAEALTWIESDRITYKCAQILPNGSSLSMLLEKDFVCLDHSDEDQSDNFPNPNKTC